MSQRTPGARAPDRPVGVQFLAALLTLYAMGGVYIGAELVTARPFLRWEPLVVGAALFVITAGAAARAVWHLTRPAARLVLACGICGAAFCIMIGFSGRDLSPAERSEVWRAAILGALLFLAFLALAAQYIQRQVDSRT